MAEFERRRQVNIDHRIPIRTPEVQHFIQLTNSGIIDEDIDRAKAFTAGGDDLLRCAFSGNIHLYKLNFNTLFFNNFFCLSVILYYAWDKQIRSRFRQSHSKGLTQPAIAAGDNCRFTFQREEIH